MLFLESALAIKAIVFHLFIGLFTCCGIELTKSTQNLEKTIIKVNFMVEVPKVTKVYRKVPGVPKGTKGTKRYRGY